MKIKVSKTFQKVLALVLCTVMLFGAAPLASFIGLIPDASAEDLYTIRFFAAYEDEPYTDLKFAEGETLFTIDAEGKKVFHDKVPFAVKEGYSFKGWQPELPEKMLAENLEVTAQWEINQYTIEFKANGGKFEDESETYTIEQAYGTAITAPAKPTKEGYTFAGWDKEIPATMPAEDITIKAQWEINKYTITFDSNGGEPVDPIEQDYKTPVTAPTTTREGYTFAGWEPSVPENMPAKDMTVTAKWGINTHTITFKNTYDSKTADIKEEYGTTITAPADPTRTGYTFTGWDNEIPATMPDYDMTISATWKANEYNITYDPNGGILVDDKGVPTQNPLTIKSTYDQAFTLPANPTRDGYTFTGWFDANDKAMAKVPAADATYYAKWTEGTGGCFYGVTYWYMGVDGKYEASPEVLYSATAGATIDIKADEESKLAVGFYIDEETENTPEKSVLTGTVPETGVLSLSVYVARTEYTIKFNANGGSATNSIKAIYGAAVTAPKDPTRDGYTFNGWKNNSTGVVENIPSAMPASDMNFTAQWVENTDTKYIVRINYADATKGGTAATKDYSFTGTTGNKVKILIDGTAADDGAIYHKLADFTLDHYRFDTAAMAKQQLEGTIGADGKTVLNLYFVPVEYTVAFEVSGHVIHDASVKYYTDANTVAPTSSEINKAFADYLPGYTFKAWEPKLSNVVADTTYVATYTANPYKIKFDCDKAVIDEEGNIKFANEDFTPETTVDTIEKDFNTEVTIPALPAKAGYDSYGWYDDAGKPYKPGSKISMPVDGLNLTAFYVAKSYIITFDANLEGAELKTTSVIEDCDEYVEITADMIPSKEGYTFIGWFDYTDAENPVKYNEGSKVKVPAHDVTLVAEWSTGKFMIIFKDEDGKFLNDLTCKDVPSDTPITAPDYTPAEERVNGRTFLGWREESKAAGDPLFVFDKMPGHSLVLKEVWGYTLTLDPTEGKIASQPTATEIEIETDLSEFIPTRTGYSFTGWFKTEDRTGDPVADKVSYPVDTTLYAGWEINDYTITFKADGGKFEDGSDVYTINQDYATDIEAPADPTKVGHTFAGWDKAVPTTMPAGDMVITAKWTVNKYTFTFLDYEAYKADGTETVISAPITQDYDTEVAAPADPVKTGYTWNSWVDEDGNEVEILEKMPAEDITYYGVWDINQYEITFDSDGGTYVAPIGGDYGTAVEIPANPTKVGYTFEGWEDEAGNIVSVPSTIPAKNLALKAVWTINQYRITFRDSDGFVYMTTVQDYGSEIVAPANPERVGSVFMGWDIGEVPETVPARNLTFTAVWKDLDYTITFKDDDGDTLKVITGKYGTKIGEIEEPRKLFYNFKGWDKEVPETMPAEDMVITAVWERDTSFIDGLESFFMSFFAILTRIVNIFSGMLV